MNSTHAFLIVEALQLTAVVCATLALMFFAMRRSALRHALGVAGLALLLASPVLALLLPRPGWLPETQPPVEPVAEFESPMTEPADAPLVSVAPAPVFESLAMPLHSTWPDDTGMSGSIPPDQSETADILVEAVEPPLIAMTESVPPDRASNASASITDDLSHLPNVLGLLWITGTVWSLVRWRRSHVRLSRLRESLTDWPAEHPIYDAGGICEELGLLRLPPIKVSDMAPMPLVLGITRPVIVLPRELAGSPNPVRLRDVILHEAAHIARRDPLVFVGQRIVAALFWWHPGVHWLNRAINRAREEVCDNHVLRRGDASAYAEMLLELVENYAGLRLELSLMGLLAPRWSLEERIAGLLNPGRNTTTRAGRIHVVVAIAALVAVCATVGGLGALKQSPAHAEVASSLPTVAQVEEPLAAPGDSPAISNPPADADSDNWPDFRNGSDLRGIATTTLPDKLELLWEVETHDGVTSTAAIANGRVYVAELSGHIRCFDLQSGNEYWHYRTIDSEEPNEFAPGFNAPVTLSESALFIGDENGTFYSLNRQSGELHWKISTDGEIKGGATILPPTTTTGAGRVIFGSHDGKLYCLNSETGERLWAFDTLGPVNGSQPVDGLFTFATGCDRPFLRVVNLQTGEQHAEVSLDESLLVATPARVGSVLYFGTPNGELVALDWRSASRLWTYSDPRGQQGIHSSPAVTDDLVFIGSRDKRLHAIDRTNGARVWAFETRGPIDSSPVVAGERIFFGSTDRQLYGLDLSGNVVWKYDAGGPISASPAVGEGHLIIGSEGPRGRILCFGEKSQVKEARPEADASTGKETREVTLRGICLDEEEVPLKSVHVRVFRFPSSIDPPILIADATTGDDGKFEFSELHSSVDRSQHLGSGDLFVAATAANRASAIWRVDSESNSAEQTLTLHSEAGSLSGTIRDGAGRPVAGAAVYLPVAFNHPFPGIMSAVTDDEGHYSIADLRCWGPPESEDEQNRREFRGMECVFLIQHPRFGITQALHRGIPRTIDVTLHPPAVVTGRVIDAVTGEPAVGVTVSAQGVARNAWVQTRADGEGRYALRLPKDHYNIWAEMPGRIAIAVKAIEARRGETARDADIRMVRGGLVYGTVIDPRTDAPYSPAADKPLRVAHHGPARPRTGAAVASTLVNPDGTYRLQVAPGRNYVYLMNDGTQGVNLDVEDGQEVQFDFRLGEALPTKSSDPDPDSQLGSRIREQARAEDETQLQKRPRDTDISRAAPAPRSEQPRQEDDTPAPAASNTETGESSWGSIAGRFVLDGDVPELRPLLTRSGEEVPDESLIVNPDSKGIANICLYLREAPADIHPSLQKSSTPAVKFDVNKNRFVPHILLARTDQQITLLNNEPFAVDVHPNPLRNAGINMVLRPLDRTGIPVTMSRPETKGPPVNVKSDIQPWMQAYWIISDHPYVALTDADGKFQIDNLPAGEHKFRVWHERTGYLKTDAFERNLTVTVPADETIELPEFHVSGAQFANSAADAD